jgi:hypothetical protein
MGTWGLLAPHKIFFQENCFDSLGGRAEEFLLNFKNLKNK